MSVVRTVNGWSGVPSSPREAREGAARLMTIEDSRSVISAEVWCDALLCTSELVAHAQQFSSAIADCRVTLDRGALDMQIVCRDARAGAFGWGMPSGWGWMIVERIATSLTVTLLPDGLIWARLLIRLH
ncbi:hypothetical protein [Streptomyces sp. NPDC059819]|uniref:hypothetical protein n=1 Tax=Streptomyces sp. NPDC059819 TaxID=3346963 RepID=UPI00366682CB